MAKPSARSSLPLVALLVVAGCGGGGSTEGDVPGGAQGGPGAGTEQPGADQGADAAPATDLVGVWAVSGKDARGSYDGQAEIRRDGQKLRLYRTVRYVGLTVEDGRELHWAISGDAKGDVRGAVTADVVLDNRGFVSKRGTLERKATDEPVRLTCTATFANGAAKASCSGPGVSAEETWSNKKPPGDAPLYVVERFVKDGHSAPSALVRSTLFATYSSYQSLPAVAPYSKRPEFQAAVHGHWIDKTDFDFYRSNKNAIRVMDKMVDAISQQEALNRANAYRMTIGEKAAGFDAELASEFLDPTTGMLLDAKVPGQPVQPHFSAALWTGVYMASQVYRYEVTKDAGALANVKKTLDGLLKLQEVTGDWSQFARAIRPATGNATGGWHPGAGALSSLEWLEGGNNDMMKGLYVSYVLGNRLLCGLPENASLCARIRTNAKHLADDINVDRGTDELDSTWLTAVVTNDPITRLTYKAKADAAWAIYKTGIVENTRLYEQGTADWSGLNLGFVGDVFKMELASVIDVGGDAKATYEGVIEDSFKGGLDKQRLPLWALVHAAYGKTGPDAAAIDDARWRLREFPFPKPTITVDQRIRPEFVMSPYPSLPWKNDWTTTDRTQGLRSVPLFEEALDIYRFRLEMRYRGDAQAHPPAPEYLIAYWFARKNGLLAATD